MTKSMIKIMSLLVIAASACGGTSSDEPGTDQARPVEVEVERARLETVSERYEVLGTVVAATEAVLSSEVLGRVTAVHVREGSRVRPGQPLVEIDNRSARSRMEEAEAAVMEVQVASQEAANAIRSAEAALEAAKVNARLALTTYQRYQELLKRDSVSRQEFDEVEARHHSAQAELKRAEQGLATAQAREEKVQTRIEQAKAGRETVSVGLSQTIIESPSDGLVTDRQVEPGDLASPGRALLTVESLGHYQLEVSVNESIATGLQLDRPVEVSLPALNLTLQADIEEVVPVTDPGTRTVLVKLRLPNRPEIRSGMFGRGFFSLGEEESLHIPEDSIIRRGQLVGVLTVDSQERARYQLIKVGRTREGRAEVLSGLDQGDLVIKDPGSIADGQPVRIATQNGSSGSS